MSKKPNTHSECLGLTCLCWRVCDTHGHSWKPSWRPCMVSSPLLAHQHSDLSSCQVTYLVPTHLGVRTCRLSVGQRQWSEAGNGAASVGVRPLWTSPWVGRSCIPKSRWNLEVQLCRQSPLPRDFFAQVIIRLLSMSSAAQFSGSCLGLVLSR